MNFSTRGLLEDHKNNCTCRGLDLTEQTKLSSLTLTVCQSRAHWISDLSCLWQRAEPVDRWRSSSPSSANYFCPGPTVPVKKPSMLSVTLSTSYHPSFPLSLCPLNPSLSLLSLCLRQRERERTLHYFVSVSIYPSIFLHLSASVHPPTPLSFFLSLPRQLWGKLISRWFCEMLIDWTVQQTYRLPLSICPPHCIARKEEGGWAGQGKREETNAGQIGWTRKWGRQTRKVKMERWTFWHILAY